MKKLLWGLLCMSGAVHAAPFNHTAIQKGARVESCYREPCSISQVISFRQIQKSANQSMIELRLLGGTQRPRGGIQWNPKPHTVVITCSKTSPVVAMDGDEETLSLNPNGVPGVQEDSAGLYLQACHAYTRGDSGQGAARFGYNLP